MKFVFGYRTELFMIFLVPIRAIQWYRFLRYSGTGSSAMMVPIRALRWYRLTDTINYVHHSVLCEYNITKDCYVTADVIYAGQGKWKVIKIHQ